MSTKLKGLIQVLKVAETAEIIGVSKTAIYNKINKNKKLFSTHIKLVDGTRFITPQGLDQLKKMFSVNQVESKFAQTENKEDQSLIKSKDEMIQLLKEQVEIKDKQIDQQAHQMDKLTELNKNNQILLKQEQDKVLLLQSKKEPLLKRLFGKKEQVS